ncbi:hypothetical protein [Myroides injenensis]|uniref:hypothetical protein n=1 Tax=Myroides injenensis TaxID=1183151 RepID=UPI0002889A35|nr:hypothetical protein [Myroides injenensis]
MAKVLRLHQDGNNNLVHWQESSAYGKAAIQGIIDGNGESVQKQITSIPSPFARYDLLKVAFEFVNNSNVDGNTIYHKMVSDCLDIAELLFDFEKHQNDFSIITWDIKNDLDTLLQSKDNGHKQLAETLKLFLTQDAKANNFDDIKQIFLLNYKKGKQKMNIIGGTSPITLFATTANNYQGEIDVFFGNRQIFSSITPLYQRNIDFQVYLHALMKSVENSYSLFPAFCKYLDLNYTLINPGDKNLINNLTAQSLQQAGYEKITTDNANNFVETLGIALYKKVVNLGEIQDYSGFVIKPNVSVINSENLPLVLPVDVFSSDLTYVKANWDRNNKAPYYDNNPLDKRILPFDGTQYPYLTVSDFLEEYIISLPYPLNSKGFQTGNLVYEDENSTSGYLLPLKEEFFKYFTYDFLTQKINGQNVLEIKERGADGHKYIAVTLRIPIQGNNVIVYQRDYITGGDFNTKQPDIANNKGAIYNYSMVLAMTPIIKYHGGKDFYRVALFDNENICETTARVNLVKNGECISTDKKVRQTKSSTGQGISSEFYVVNNEFDVIQVLAGTAKGVMIPNWIKGKSNSIGYKFAVDFGTTNTHIEYSTSVNKNPIPFEITQNDVQLIKSYDKENKQTKRYLKSPKNKALDDTILKEFLPDLIENTGEFFFPQRTVLSHNLNLNLQGKCDALADFTIPFHYTKRIDSTKVDDIKTDLKWTQFGSKTEDQVKVEGYLETLMFLMYNKVILNEGDLNTVELRWLYPTSMSKFNLVQLDNSWNKLFKKYFNNNSDNLVSVTEAIAPYHFYKTQGIQSMSNSVVSVDIGGGTTDVVVFTNDSANLLSSFRFAANNLFGDASNTQANKNAYVNKYNSIYNKVFSDNQELSYLSQIASDILSKNKSEEFVSFLFSLENRPDFIENHAFSQKLINDNELKIGPLVFVTSIVYYIAKTMKAKEIISPAFFTFSGTGSKILNILDSSKQKTLLSEYVSIIFQNIYQDPTIEIQIEITDKVKEISCKGALLLETEEADIKLDKVKYIYEKINDEGILRDLNYKEAEDPEFILDRLNEYNEFVEWMFNLNKRYSFQENFGIPSEKLSLYKNSLLKQAKGYYGVEFKNSLKSQNGNQQASLEETLFFYPLKGTINNMLFDAFNDNEK